MAYLMGIDLGTSSLRAGIYRDNGSCAGIASRGYGIDIPSPGFAEQRPETWWSAACGTIWEALTKAGIRGDELAGISFSGQMHGTVLLDRYHDPVCPAIIWADSRSSDICEELEEIIGHDRLRKVLMNRIFPGTQAATVSWLMRHERDTWNHVRRILAPKDYLRWRMCGLFNTEPTDASATLLFDVGLREWSKEVLEALSVPVEYLPFMVNSDQYIGETEGIEEETGIPDGVTVILGGGDQPCAALGNGVIDEGSLLVTIGTGGQLFAPTTAPKQSPGLALNTFCHLPASRWYVMGATLSAGLSLKWFRDAFHPGTDFDTLTAEAETVPAGSDGLQFLPYLNGRRSPSPDPSAAGSFTGIGLIHSRGHYVRAILEGVAYELRENLDVMKGLGISPGSVIFSGGASRSDLWSRIIADVFNLPVSVSGREEPSCFGAALTAGVGTGVYADWHEAANKVDRSSRTFEPEPGVVDIYRERYAFYVKELQAQTNLADITSESQDPPE